MKYRARCVKEPGRPILGVVDNKMLRLKRLERLRVAPALEIKMRWLVSLADFESQFWFDLWDEMADIVNLVENVPGTWKSGEATQLF